MGRFEGISSLGGLEIQRYCPPATAAFGSLGTSTLIRYKTFQSHQKEGAEFAWPGLNTMQAVLFQQTGEESLRMIFRVRGVISLTAKVGI